LNFGDEEEELINVKKDTTDSGVEELDDKKYSKFVEKTMQVIERITEVGLPEENHQIRIVTLRTFNAVLFLKHIAQQEQIEELIVAIYSINHEAARMINDIIIEHDATAELLISNLRNKAHRRKEIATKEIFMQNPRIKLMFASSHAKIMAIKTKAGNHYVLEGSGNLSFNSRIEQYVLDNDPKLYQFTYDWFQEIKTYLQGKKELEIT